MEIIEKIELDRIIPDPNNRRIGGFDQKKLEQLADSIRAVGVQQPIVVRQVDGQYHLVAGERRWKASQMAEMMVVPAVVRELSDLQVLKIQTIENLQREDVHPLDEADGYHRLLEKAHYDVEALAKEVGKSISYIYQRLKLRELIPGAREALAEGTITAGHAILIARLQPGAQDEALEAALGAHRWNNVPLSVRELDDYIQSEILHDLNRAAFKKDDADLVPDAGACTTCPKRTGFNPELFPEIQKTDKCMDGECYTAKADAYVENQRQALKEEEAESFEAIPRNAGAYDPGKTEKAIDSWNWQECKKADPEAKRVLIVAGPDRGRLTYGKKTGGFSRVGKTPEEKEKAREEKRQQKIAAEIRRRLWHKVMQQAEEKDFEGGLVAMPVEMLRFCVKTVAGRAWFEYQKKIVQLEGWEIDPRELAEKAGELDYLELQMLLYRIALVGSFDGPSTYWIERPKDELKAEAVRLGVDIEAIEAAVKEEMKPKKKKTKAKLPA